MNELKGWPFEPLGDVGIEGDGGFPPTPTPG